MIELVTKNKVRVKAGKRLAEWNRKNKSKSSSQELYSSTSQELNQELNSGTSQELNSTTNQELGSYILIGSIIVNGINFSYFHKQAPRHESTPPPKRATQLIDLIISKLYNKHE